MTEPKACEVCPNDFTPRYPGQRTCSPRCRAQLGADTTAARGTLAKGPAQWGSGTIHGRRKKKLR